MTVRRGAAVLLVTVAPLLPTAAAAGWSAAGAGNAPVAASTMTNATGFTAKCTTSKSNSSVSLAWTISPDTYVERYEIVRTSSTGATGTLHPSRTTSALTDSPPTTAGVSYTYTIRAESTTIAWKTPRLTATGKPTYTKSSCTF